MADNSPLKAWLGAISSLAILGGIVVVSDAAIGITAKRQVVEGAETDCLIKGHSANVCRCNREAMDAIIDWNWGRPLFGPSRPQSMDLEYLLKSNFEYCVSQYP